MKHRFLDAGRHPIFALTFALVVAVALGRPGATDERESAKRDAWQRPAEVMEKLGIKPGSTVADVGCGGGYFTFRMAERVGPKGKVYAEDIDRARLNEIDRRAQKEHLVQIQVILGAPDDPHLPTASLDAILVVDAFHEMDRYDAMLQGMYRALKTGGLLGIIDGKTDLGQPRSSYHAHHRIPLEMVRQDLARNGFLLLRAEKGFERPDGKQYYFLVFQKPEPDEGS